MTGQTRLRNLHWIVLVVLALTPAAVLAGQDNDYGSQAPQDRHPSEAVDADTQTPSGEAQAEEDAKVISGMSVLGNQEAPTSLVIVPWKSSEIGDSVGISTVLDDSRSPVDKDVFMRELDYYEIRSETKP